MNSTHPLTQLAQAATLIQHATTALTEQEPAAGHAAFFARLVEHVGEQLLRAQIHAVDALRRTGAHQLDPDSFQAISDAGLNPSAAELTATAGRTTMGRSYYSNTVDLLHNWLNIPLTTARERVSQAESLIAAVTSAGARVDPLLPELADHFNSQDTDPRLILSAARQIRGAQKDLAANPDAVSTQEQLERDAITLIRDQPQSARKHVNHLVEQVVSAQRPLDALLAEAGLYRRGTKRGLVTYQLKVLPQDAELLESIFTQIDNPQTIAGNRDSLNELVASRYGTVSETLPEVPDSTDSTDSTDQYPGDVTSEPANSASNTSDWPDPSSMPDWARETPSSPPSSTVPAEPKTPAPLIELAELAEAPTHTTDETPQLQHPFNAPQETAGTEQHPSGRKSGTFHSDTFHSGNMPAELSLPLEDVRPEFRHLIALVELIRNAGADSPGKRAGSVTPEVMVILNYEKMVAGDTDFAITANGLPLSAGAARAALCEAKIYPEVLNSKGMILDFGRARRLFPKHVGKAVRAAYRGCSYPGCTMPAHRCELDHLDPWEKGGPTNVDNVDLYCKMHHLARHCGLFKVVKVQGCRPMVLLPHNLDPPQKLRVNTFWMTPSEAIAANKLAEEATLLYRAGQLQPFAA